MKNTSTEFKSEKNGYARAQVDEYIKMMSQAYQEAFEENQALQEMYHNLMGEFTSLAKQECTGSNTDILVKTLADAELHAQKIVDDAKSEAQRLLTEAFDEAAGIVVRARSNLREAQETMERTVGKVQNLLTFTAPHIESILLSSKN